MSTPKHVKSHNEICQTVAMLADKDPSIGAVIVITIGADRRPALGAFGIENASEIHTILRSLGAAEDMVEKIQELDIPSAN